MFISRYKSWAHRGKSRVQLLPVSRWVPKTSNTQITCSCVFPFFRKDAEGSKSCKTAKTALFEGNFKPLCAWRNAIESRAFRGFVPGPQ